MQGGNMTDQSEFTQFNGKGMFTSGSCRIESRFTLQRQFSHTIFLIKQEDGPAKAFSCQFNNSDLWSLSGHLDDGRAIFADQLMLARSGGTEGSTDFSPLAGVIIGQSWPTPPVEARYPLLSACMGGDSQLKILGGQLK